MWFAADDISLAADGALFAADVVSFAVYDVSPTVYDVSLATGDVSSEPDVTSFTAAISKGKPGLGLNIGAYAVLNLIVSICESNSPPIV